MPLIADGLFNDSIFSSRFKNSNLKTEKHVCVCMNACRALCVCTRLCAEVSIRVQSCVCVCVCLCVCVCRVVCMCVCVCVCVWAAGVYSVGISAGLRLLLTVDPCSGGPGITRVCWFNMADCDGCPRRTRLLQGRRYCCNITKSHTLNARLRRALYKPRFLSPGTCFQTIGMKEKGNATYKLGSFSR